MSDFTPLTLETPDGLAIEARRYPGGAKTPALCLHGLTRNVRDFEPVAPFVAATGRDAIALSFRGRSGSAPDPDYLNYRPATYVGDVLAVMDQAGLDRAAFVGTSLGGLVTMLTAAAAPDRVAGAVLNDIGPDLGEAGIVRIAAMVGETRGDAPDLDGAAAMARAANEHAFPDRGDAFWRAFARRTFREKPGGGWALDYDQKIGKALVEASPTEGLWEAWEALAVKPTLLVRGALSDLLTPEIVQKMRRFHANFDYCEVQGVGHAPILDEPEAKAAILAFLEEID